MPQVFAACIAPSLPSSEAGDWLERRVDDLTLTEIEPDMAVCESGAVFPLWWGRDYHLSATGEWRAFQLENQEGQSWVVQYAIGDTSTLTLPSVAALRQLGASVGGSAPHQGYLALESNESPLIFLAYSALPQFAAWEPLSLQPITPSSADDACGSLRRIEISVGQDKQLLDTDGEAEIGGLVIRNDLYLANMGCGSDAADHFVLAGFRNR
jgi:hypothetical protein